jgi:hypothetical protein
MVTVHLFRYILLVFNGGGHYKVTSGSETSEDVWTRSGNSIFTLILWKNCLPFVLAYPCSLSFLYIPSLCTCTVVWRHGRKFLQHTVKPNVNVGWQCSLPQMYYSFLTGEGWLRETQSCKNEGNALIPNMGAGSISSTV